MGKENQVWVGGIDDTIGLLRHYTGAKWENNSVSASSSLWRVWGNGPSDVWLVGSDTKSGGFVLRGNGSHFERLPFEGASLRAIWGSASDDVWVAAYSGETYHWNGSAWSDPEKIEDAKWLGIWGASSHDVWAVGFSGVVAHYDGAHWSSSRAPTDQILWSVWGSAANDVWAVGNAGTILHWNGDTWSAPKR
jgi:hypothetical protein